MNRIFILSVLLLNVWVCKSFADTVKESQDNPVIQTSNNTVSAKSSNAEPSSSQVKSSVSLALSDAQVQKLTQLFKSDSLKPTAKAAVKSVLPVTPAQVEALKADSAALNRAIQATPIQQDQLMSTVRSINLTNNATPPLLHLVTNYATNISFVGENGKPWPLENIVPGNKDIISINPASKMDLYNSTVLVRQPWGSSNITYYLKGRVKPIILFVHTAPDTSQGLDSSISITVDGVPPGTDPLPVKNVGAVSDALLNAVDYAPGREWQTVKLSQDNLPVGLKMWLSPDHHSSIVRISSGQLVSPDWSSQASNPDNTVTAYAFNTVPLMLLINGNDGQSYQIHVNQAVEALAGNDLSLTNETKMDITNISAIEKSVQTRIQHVKK